MSFLGSVGGFLGHIAAGVGDVATGNFGGALTQGLAALGVGASGPPSAATPGSIFNTPAGPGGVTVAGGASINGLGSVAGGIAFGGGGGAVSPGTGGACPRGYHLNKHALPASRRHGAVPKLSVCVRNRHMNPMNGRAVARAARRIHRGEKLLRRIFQVEGKRHGKIRPKGGRKRS